MPTSPLRARRRLLALVLVATLPTLAFREAVAARTVRAPASPRNRADSAVVHRDLRKAIERFQDAWRKAWQRAEIKRHRPVDLTRIRGWMVQGNGVILGATGTGDRESVRRTPDLRRYLAILCYVDSPTDREIEFVKSRAGDRIGFSVSRTPPWKAPVGGLNGLGRTSFVTPRLIEGTINNGAVCPSWTPEDEPLPPDEGESIDLALPAANREPLRHERDLLIRRLEDAHAQFPRDPWIAGQRLRFVIDQRTPERTLAAARACRGDPAWCTELLGLAQAQADDVPAAEAAYRLVDSLAAASAGAESPCIDGETLLLFSAGNRSRLQRASCDQRRELVRRMWWLADPFWSVPGNERYVAHGTRRTQATLRAALHRDERYVWDPRGGGSAMREMVVRYGWPGYTYWPGGQFESEMNVLREDPRKPRFAFPPYTAKEYSPDRAALVPAFDAIDHPFTADSSHWALYSPAGTAPDSWWPQEHMMLRTRLEPLSRGQQVEWRRDTALVLAMAIDDPLRDLDTAATGPSIASLVASSGPDSFRMVSRTQVTAGGTLRFHGEIPSASVVLSAEILARTLRESSRRLRHGLRPPPALRELRARDVALSDPVFLRLPSRNVPAPTDLATVLALMAGDVAFARTEPLALYWESYGFAATDTLHFAMRVVRNEKPGVVRRIGAALGVASDRRDSISIRWTEPDARQGTVIATAGTSAVGRSIAIDLRSLVPGQYVVSLETRGRGNVAARSEREFTVREE